MNKKRLQTVWFKYALLTLLVLNMAWNMSCTSTPSQSATDTPRLQAGNNTHSQDLSLQGAKVYPDLPEAKTLGKTNLSQESPRLSTETTVKTPTGEERTEKLEIEVPPEEIASHDALAIEVRREQVEPTDLQSREKALSSVYQVQSETTFHSQKMPLKIRLNYDAQIVPKAQENPANTYALVWNGEAWEPVFGEINPESKTLEIPLTTLSPDQGQPLRMTLVTSDLYEALSLEKAFQTQDLIDGSSGQTEANTPSAFDVIYFPRNPPEGEVPVSREDALLVLNTLNQALEFYRQLGFNESDLLLPYLAQSENGKYKVYADGLSEGGFGSFYYGSNIQASLIRVHLGQIDETLNQNYGPDYPFRVAQIQHTTAHELAHAMHRGYYEDHIHYWSSALTPIGRWFKEGLAEALASHFIERDLPNPEDRRSFFGAVYRLYYPLFDSANPYRSQNFFTYLQQRFDQPGKESILHRIFAQVTAHFRSGHYPEIPQGASAILNKLVDDLNAAIQEQEPTANLASIYWDFVQDRAYLHQFKIHRFDQNPDHEFEADMQSRTFFTKRYQECHQQYFENATCQDESIPFYILNQSAFADERPAHIAKTVRVESQSLNLKRPGLSGSVFSLKPKAVEAFPHLLIQLNPQQPVDLELGGWQLGFYPEQAHRWLPQTSLDILHPNPNQYVFRDFLNHAETLAMVLANTSYQTQEGSLGINYRLMSESELQAIIQSNDSITEHFLSGKCLPFSLNFETKGCD